MRSAFVILAVLSCGTALACRASPHTMPAAIDTDATAPPASVPALVSSAPEPEAAPSATVAPPLVLVAGGDIDLSRGTGQRILRDPSYDPFTEMRPLLSQADLRFANLESPLSDQGGITGSKDNPLVFTGPPQGADVLTRGGFDIVSTANNHAWDYGKRGLEETLANLDRVGIAHAGTDASGRNPWAATVLERRGYKIAFLAVTGIFNDGPAQLPEPRKYIASAHLDSLAREIAAVRNHVDWVVASVHIGEEYADIPIDSFRNVLSGAARFGADVVLGHHPHTPQRIEYHHGRPVVFSLGNFVFHEHSNHPWTGWGYLVRVTLERQNAPRIEVCPYHLLAARPQPLTQAQDSAFFAHYDAISKHPAAARVTTRSADGCALMQPPSPAPAR